MIYIVGVSVAVLAAGVGCGLIWNFKLFKIRRNNHSG